jgi:ferredoxin--NADP+ reductase
VSHILKLSKKKVTNIEAVANGVFVLSFVRDFKFTAGQVVAIDLIPDGKPRLYSIASGENETNIDILFYEKKDGQLTPFLSKLLPGDIIYVSDPFGTFRTEPGKAYWIASGTGVAPFVSMVRSGLAKNKTLIHGGRMDENFYFSSLLEKEIINNYIRCNSQQEDTLHFKGRLTEWLKTKANFVPESKYYLCGSAEMVVQVRDLLISKGIHFQNIISETYF